MAVPAPKLVNILGPKYALFGAVVCDFCPCLHFRRFQHDFTVQIAGSYLHHGVYCVHYGISIRLSMIIGAIPYILGCLANIDPTYGLTVPAFGLIGIGAALIWTGQAVSILHVHCDAVALSMPVLMKMPQVQVYLSRCAMRESMKTGERQDRVSSKFNGMVRALFGISLLSDSG
jgi:hypothetical protein